METIHDGFVLSEKTCSCAGGPAFGYAQHGLPDLHAADIIRDVALLSEARDEAASFVDGPAAEEQVLSALKRRFGGSFQKLLNN